MRNPLIYLGTVGLFTACAIGCSSPASDSGAVAAEPGNRGSAPAADSSSTNVGDGRGGTSSLNVGNAGTTASTGSAIVDSATACVADVKTGQQAPVDLYFMVDKSGSMACPTDANTQDCMASKSPRTGQSRWDAVTGALKDFVTTPADNGIGAGINFFPQIPDGAQHLNGACMVQCDPSDCGCMKNCGCQQCACRTFGSQQFCGCTDNDPDSACQAQNYAKPTLEIADLPGAAEGFGSALAQQGPGGHTPTVPALQGALQHAKDWAATHLDHRVAVVLTTDGEPDGCDANNSIDTAVEIAASAAAQSPSISTYVIGVGPSLDNLNRIAKAGGSDQAYLVQSGAEAARQLSDALNSIRERALSCDYVIPLPKSGDLDYSQVNVRLAVGSSGTQEIIAQALSKDQCGSAPAWFYDTPAAPKVITLCPSACDAVLKTPGSKLEVLIGCKTIAALPK